MPKSICTYPGCNALVDSGRCEKHPYKPHLEDRRVSAARRGYDHRWVKLREFYLVRHPVCELKHHCKGDPAVLVDHKIPISLAPTRRLDQANLQSLCMSCHNWKTKRIDPLLAQGLSYGDAVARAYSQTDHGS